MQSTDFSSSCWDIFGNSSMRTKLSCHNLLNGPRPIRQNVKLFKELIVFTQIQTELVGAIVLTPNVQDTISRIFFHLTTFLSKIILYDDCMTDTFRNSLPVKLNFI